MRNSQGSLRYSKPNGPSNENFISCRQLCFEQETGARRSPPSCTITGLDAIPTGTQAPVSGTSCSPALPCPRHCAVQSGAGNTPCSPVFPLQVPQANPFCLLEVQGVGRAALQDALDVLLKGMLRLGHDAQRGHGQVLVLAGAQQGRGGRVDSAPTTAAQGGTQSEHSNSNQLRAKLLLQVRSSCVTAGGSKGSWFSYEVNPARAVQVKLISPHLFGHGSN